MKNIKVQEFGYRIDAQSKNPNNGALMNSHIELVTTEEGPKGTIILWDGPKFWTDIKLDEIPAKDKLEQTVTDLFRKYINPHVGTELVITEMDIVFVGKGEIARSILGFKLPPKEWRVTTRATTQLECEWVIGKRHKESIIQARSIWPMRWAIDDLPAFKETLDNLIKAHATSFWEWLKMVIQIAKE